jgi:hypothetical protein
MAHTRLKLFVISDLHAFDGNSGGPEARADDFPSHLNIAAASGHNPLTSLEVLIKSENLTADALLCCGDMCDKAYPSAISYVWDKLQLIKVQLTAPTLFATLGNHDLDSRYKYINYDAKGYIQLLTPGFPVADEGHSNRFWAKHFTVFDSPDMRTVILNSSAYHGCNDEYKHGRIADSTLSMLRDTLKTTPKRDVNLLLCHHHPLRHAEVPIEDYSEMKNGAGLLKLLGSGEFGSWLLVHGHIHYPKIEYAPGGAASPVIFSAGSLSAQLYSSYGPKVRNQCYLLELPVDEIRSFGLVVGRFKAWDWTPGIGWIPARVNSGLPHYGGFGCRESAVRMAKKVRAAFSGKPNRLDWNHLEAQIDDLSFVLPQDIANLRTELKSQHQISVLVDEYGRPQQAEIV